MHTLQIIQKILIIIFPLISIAILGFLYAKKYHTDMSIANKLNIDIFCPALIFSVVSSKSFNILQYKTLALSTIVIILCSGLIAWILCKLLKIQPKTLLPPVMFNNTGNMGLPLMVLAFGEQALPVAVVFFIIENTLHFTLGTFMLDRHSNPLNVIKVPMIFVTIIALFISYFQWDVPEYLSLTTKMLGNISIPLMLFALGVRMTSIDFSAWKIGLIGAIAAPVCSIIIAILLLIFGGLSSTDFNYLLLFSALPPAILNYMIAEKYHQEPQNVASIVLLGNLLSVVIIPIILFIILSY